MSSFLVNILGAIQFISFSIHIAALAKLHLPLFPRAAKSEGYLGGFSGDSDFKVLYPFVSTD